MKRNLSAIICLFAFLTTGCVSTQAQNNLNSVLDTSESTVDAQENVKEDEIAAESVRIAKNFAMESAENGYKITFTNENNVVDEEYTVNKGTLSLACALLRDTQTGETVRRYDPLISGNGDSEYNGITILSAAMSFSPDYIPENGGIGCNAFKLEGEFTLKGAVSPQYAASGDAVEGVYELILSDSGGLPSASNVSDVFRIFITEDSELYEKAVKLCESGEEMTVKVTNPTVEMNAFSDLYGMDSVVTFESAELL